MIFYFSFYMFPLSIAIKNNNTEIFKILLSNPKTDINQKVYLTPIFILIFDEILNHSILIQFKIIFNVILYIYF